LGSVRVEPCQVGAAWGPASPGAQQGDGSSWVGAWLENSSYPILFFLVYIYRMKSLFSKLFIVGNIFTFVHGLIR